MTPALRNACLADGTTRLVGIVERSYLRNTTEREAWLGRLVAVLDLIRSNRQNAYWQNKWRVGVRPLCVALLSVATMADLDNYIGIN